MRRTLLLPLAVLPLAAAAFQDTDDAAPEPETSSKVDAKAALTGITAAELQAHVDYLASDELAGRYAKSDEARTAAKYIAKHFESSGLEPLGDDGTWFQAVEEGMSPNVVGVVRGSADEYVVLTAHYDHLKPAKKGTDLIYNGADDNASGTAAVLELAQAFGSLDEPPARSILFVAFTAEEMGLRGARYFVAHPPIPLDEMVGNINMDMISRGKKDVIFSESGGGAEHLVAAAKKHATKSGLKIQFDKHPDWIMQSDHFAFIQKEVPAIYFGVEDHADYHQVSDHADKIIPELVENVARLVFRMANSL
jgi:Zn-dependent M28 family amino/carboxypeptidase